MVYSILITSYECHGKGVDYLRENLESIFSQTYRPIQCIVSDHSRDTLIEKMVNTLDPKGVDFIYIRYPDNYGNPVLNWKNALQYATGEYIHYFAMDECFSSIESVHNIVKCFEENPMSMWVACSQLVKPRDFVFTPSWNSMILQNNTLSGPSAIVIRSQIRDIEMDERFIWYLDIDWYYRLWKHVGVPYIIHDVTIIGRQHEYQLTNTVCTTERRALEDILMREKYGDPLPYSC